MNLDELIASVDEDTRNDPLDQISAAASVRDDIEFLGDSLVDHFVNEARSMGCSWAQIGNALGVTRQAAQQRHVGWLSRRLRGLSKGLFKRFTKKARASVIAAQTAARDRNHAAVDTEHILLGLYAGDETNVAVLALHGLGVDRARVEGLVDERMEVGHKPVRGHLPFTPLSKKTLEVALREAVRLDHAYIGCEHILLALCRVDEGGAAQILREQGLTIADLETAVLEVLEGPTETS